MRIETWHKNLAVLWLAQGMTMVAISFVLPFFPLYVQELGVTGTAQSAQWAAAAIAGAAVTMTIAQPFWGQLADKYGRRPMVIRSMLGAGVCVAAMGFVNSPELLVVVRLIQGTLSGSIAAGNALVATSTPKKSIGLAMGLMQVSLFVGSAIGPLGGGLIADTWGFRTCFYLAGGLMLLGGVLVVLFVREDFVRPVHVTKQPGFVASTKALFGIAFFPTVISVILLTHFGGSVMAPVLTLFIAELSGEGNAASSAGIIIAANGIVGAVAAILVGRMGDRFGHGRILPICLIGGTLVYMLQGFVHELWELFALRVVLGCFLGGLMPSANALLVSVVPVAMRGSAFGISGATSSAASVLGPMLGAGVASFAGLRAVFFASAALYGVGFVWVVAEFRRHRGLAIAIQEASAPQPSDPPGPSEPIT